MQRRLLIQQKILDEADLVLLNTCSIREKAEHNCKEKISKYIINLKNLLIQTWLSWSLRMYGRKTKK